MKEKKYLGFGVEKSVSGWARFLKLPYATVWRQLEKGLTPEEIAIERELTLDMGELHELPKRVRDRIEEVEELMADLLDRSNYDPDGLVVTMNQESGLLSIVWNYLAIGLYDYQKDVLHLTGGDGLRVRRPLVSDPMIKKNEAGKWVIHPETKVALVDRLTRH